MEIVSNLSILAAIIFIVVGLKFYAEDRKEKRRKRPPVDTPPPAPPPPPKPQPPIRRFIYIDDAVLSLTADKGGDFNHPNDLAFVLAACVQNDARPLAIGATCVGNNRGVSSAVPQQLVKASGLDIPVYLGNPSYKPGSSKLSQYIADESHKGALSICVGSPCNDLADAVRLGGNTDNIYLYIIGRGTWNERTDPRTRADSQAATDLVYSKYRHIDDVREYRKFLKCPYGNDWSEAFIKRWRAQSELCNLAFGDFVSQQNRNMNNAQRNGQNPMRIADFMTVERYFGLNYTNFDGVIRRFERGITLMGQR